MQAHKQPGVIHAIVTPRRDAAPHPNGWACPLRAEVDPLPNALDRVEVVIAPDEYMPLLVAPGKARAAALLRDRRRLDAGNPPAESLAADHAQQVVVGLLLPIGITVNLVQQRRVDRPDFASTCQGILKPW